MDEFNPIDYNGNTENVDDTIPQTEPQASEPITENVQEDFSEPTTSNPIEPSFIPVYNPINFTPVKPVEDAKPMSRGLKFFAIIMVAIILLTTACTAGYFLGQNSNKTDNAVIGLLAKPQKTEEMTPAQVYQEVSPSIVGICVYNSKGAGANATGVIYSEDGYIITNDHIYADVAAAKFKIYTHDNKEYDAEFVAGDKVSDLAVLKIKDGKFKAAQFGNSDQLIFGENVVAIGRPGGYNNASSITKGIISATFRRVQTTSSYSARLIETDSPINPGSSGGALVNMYGQVIGITSSKLASADVDAVGYAIPTTVMKRIAEELIKNGKVLSRAKLGITYTAIDSVTAAINDFKYTGLKVVEVAADSDLYGKLQSDDIITHINGIEVTDDDLVLDIIEKAKAGDKVTVDFINKNGKTKRVEAVLKANIGESSYVTTEKNPLPNDNSSNSQGGGAFDFPFGE